jgi:hypothetical protein
MKRRSILTILGLVITLAGCAGGPLRPPDTPADLTRTAPPGGGQPVVVPLEYRGTWIGAFADDGTVRLIQRVELEHGTFTHFAGRGGWYRRGGRTCLVESSTWKTCFDAFGWKPQPNTAATAGFETFYDRATLDLGGRVEVGTPAGERALVFGPHRDRGDRGDRQIANPAGVGSLSYPGLGGCILYGTPIPKSVHGEPFRFACGGEIPVDLEVTPYPDGKRELTGRYAGVPVAITLPAHLPDGWAPLR